MAAPNLATPFAGTPARTSPVVPEKSSGLGSPLDTPKLPALSTDTPPPASASRNGPPARPVAGPGGSAPGLYWSGDKRARFVSSPACFPCNAVSGLLA